MPICVYIRTQSLQPLEEEWSIIPLKAILMCVLVLVCRILQAPTAILREQC